MSSIQPLPLGQPIPDSLHGVSCSLPTMRSVIGYEEKDPAITRHLTSGYPRFVQHPFLKQAAKHILERLGWSGHSLWLTSSARAAQELAQHLAEPSVRQLEGLPVSGVAFLDTPALNSRAKTFLQHSGMLLSSREAEDYLLRVGVLAEPQAEASFDGYAASHVKGSVARSYRHVAPSDVFLANSGMNAIYAAFRVAAELQRAQGRTRWIQLGWLYLDTIAILQKFTDSPADYLFQNNVFDLDALRRLFEENRGRIAGIITEVPTNPLIQTADLPAVHALCREHGALLVVDPTIASPYCIDVVRHADVVANSLTKYTASEGDIIMGAVVVNPAGPQAAAFRARLPAALEPVYSRDVSRLAAQIGETSAVMAQINATTPKVIEFLRHHPKVGSLFWSQHPDSARNYQAIAAQPNAVGSMLSFTVTMPLADFYDRLRLAKGPSFGMKTTLICPFIYLAHYDLVTSEEGQKKLAANGLSPELLRLSIGCEPAEEIIAALAEAFG